MSLYVMNSHFRHCRAVSSNMVGAVGGAIFFIGPSVTSFGLYGVNCSADEGAFARLIAAPAVVGGTNVLLDLNESCLVAGTATVGTIQLRWRRSPARSRTRVRCSAIRSTRRATRRHFWAREFTFSHTTTSDSSTHRSSTTRAAPASYSSGRVRMAPNPSSVSDS